MSCTIREGEGRGGRYLTEKREGEEPLSLTLIGRLMPLEIVVNRAIVYSLNTIPLCYKCMMQAAEICTLGRSLYKMLRSIKTLRSIKPLLYTDILMDQSNNGGFSWDVDLCYYFYMGQHCNGFKTSVDERESYIHSTEEKI